MAPAKDLLNVTHCYIAHAIYVFNFVNSVSFLLSEEGFGFAHMQT